MRVKMAGDKYLLLFCTFNLLCFVTCELNLSEGSPCVTQGLRGTCVNIFKCNSAALTYLYANAGFDLVKSKIPDLPDICSYKDNEPVVCCTDCEIGEEKYRNLAVGPLGDLFYINEDSLARQKCFEYFKSLPFWCRYINVVKSDEINRTWFRDRQCPDGTIDVISGAGGFSAAKWEFPHMALLGYGDSVESAQWLCGGSVISERFILTAAHCTSTKVLGSISYAALGILKRSDPKESWKIYKIKRIIIHPEYKAPSKYHDIALLETENEIAFGRDLLPACLDVYTENYPYATATGWGLLGYRQALADGLQMMMLEEFNETECSAMYRPHRLLSRGYDHDTQMCYGRRDVEMDTCEGDSGGPLQEDISSCLYHIVGVTSYGRHCAVLGSAGMYTRVSYYVPWIESVVWPEETEARRRKDQPSIDTRSSY